MTKIGQNLEKVLDAKNSIKQALVSKGIDMTDVPFESYPSKIEDIQSEGSGNANVIYKTNPNDIYFENYDKYQSFSSYIVYEGNEYRTITFDKTEMIEENSADGYDFVRFRVNGDYYPYNHQLSQLDDISYCFEAANYYGDKGEITAIYNLPVADYSESLESMFSGCFQIKTIPSRFKITSNVKNTSYMFSSCNCLEYLDATDWDMSNVTRMNGMFENCSDLTHIKCNQSFKDWCIENQDNIQLPSQMRDGGSGTWEIVD